MPQGEDVIQVLIEEFSKLPSIGPKSAARIVYYLLNMPDAYSSNLIKSIIALKRDTKRCRICFNIAFGEDICSICADTERNRNLICVVEEPLDILSFERGNIFNGIYHVLGGVISPLKGIGPEDIRIKELLQRVHESKEKNTELILALNPDMEGEATSMYISEKFKDMQNVKVTRIARGLPTGADIEYADNMTLSKALENRTSI